MTRPPRGARGRRGRRGLVSLASAAVLTAGALGAVAVAAASDDPAAPADQVASVGDRRGDVDAAPRYRSRDWAALRASYDIRLVDVRVDQEAQRLTVDVLTRGRAVPAPRGTRQEVRTTVYGDRILDLVGRTATGRVRVEPEDPELGPVTACSGGSVTARRRHLVLAVPFACLDGMQEGRLGTYLALQRVDRDGSVRASNVTDASRTSRTLTFGPPPQP